MLFRFHTKQVSQATQGFALIMLVAGMLLIGFGMLIFALPKLFAAIAAGVFFFIGLSVVGYAIRLFMAASRIKRSGPDVDIVDEEGDHRRKFIHVDVEDEGQ